MNKEDFVNALKRDVASLGEDFPHQTLDYLTEVISGAVEGAMSKLNAEGAVIDIDLRGSGADGDENSAININLHDDSANSDATPRERCPQPGADSAPAESGPMNKQSFLRALERGLAPLREEDRRQALDYYAEMIADAVENGASEEDAVAGFDAPESIAAQLCAESEQVRHGAHAEPHMPDEPWEYSPKGDVHTVVVDARLVGVRVRHSSDGRVRVWFTPRENERITAEEADGVFRFTHKPSLLGSGRLFGIVIDRREAVLEVPRDFSGTVCVKTSESSVCAGDLSLGGTVQLVTRNSNIRVERGVFDALRCKTSNSSIALSDTDARDCEAATSNSSITAERCAFGSYLCKTSNARVTLTDTAGERCEAVTDNARVTAERCRFAHRLWLTTSNGPIHIDAIAAPDVSLQTSNGAIKGTLLGDEADYAVTARTSNAKNNLRDVCPPDAPNRLRAVTSNGRIELLFLPEPPESGV